jgi:hypothetical protein
MESAPAGVALARRFFPFPFRCLDAKLVFNPNKSPNKSLVVLA